MMHLKGVVLTLFCYHFFLLVRADDQSVALTLVQTDDEDVTVEENGGNIEQPSFIDKSAEPFYPTDEWQTVKEGQAIPAGLHVRLNLQTGEREAKLMEGDSGLKYWKIGDQQDMVKKSQKFSVDELKKALKDFRTTKLDEVDLQREEDVKAKFRSYKQLKEEFGAMDVGIKTDGQIVEELVNKIQREDIEREELVTHLQDLEYYVHQYDNAVVLKDYGGMRVLVSLMNTSKDEDIKMEIAMVIGAAASSNPQVQIASLQAGALHLLLKMMSTEKSANIRRKVLYAISTICRNFPHAQERFLHLGGLSVLGNLLKEADVEKLQIKAISFLNDLILEKDDVINFSNPDKSSEAEKLRQYKAINLREAMYEQGWCEQVPRLLTVSEHDSREQVLKLMTSLRETCHGNFSSSHTVLHQLQEEYTVLQKEELSEDGDDQYFTQMLKLVTDLITFVDRKEDL